MKEFFRQRKEAGPIRLDGPSVKRARMTAGLTQEQVANRMELLGYFLPQSYVSNLERGEYRWGFTERMAAALAAALGVGVADLAGGCLLSYADAQRIQKLVSDLGALVGPGTTLRAA